MSDIKVGITGATGFIGCRLAERLILGDREKFSVVAAIRRFSGPGLARLARLPVQFEVADLLDADALATAFSDCDVVVHCAYGTKGSSEERRRVTVEGTRNALRAALGASANRFIHLSTAVVHETGGRNPVTENTPYASGGDSYVTMKQEAEDVVWEAHASSGLPAVVLRPTLVHGPYGRRWTERIAAEVQSGAIVPEEAARTPANLVYVDNVVNAILEATTREDAPGEGFILVDDDPPSWLDVYRAYAERLPEAPPLEVLSQQAIEAERRRIDPGLIRGSFVEPIRVAPRMIRAAFRPQSVRDGLWKIPWVAAPARLLPEGFKDRLKGEGAAKTTSQGTKEAAPGYPLPVPAMVDMYTSPVRFSNAKANRFLGDWQRTDFSTAMNRIGAWLRYQRIARPEPAGVDG